MGEPAERAGRLAYADLLRVLAMCAVVVLHISSSWQWTLTGDDPRLPILLGYDALSRWGVSLFFMLSGMFLLDPQKEVRGRDLARRVLRVLTALLAWGLFYALISFGRPTGDLSFTAAGIWEALRHVLSADTQYHLWFLYTLLGLYLVTPILRGFIRGSGRSEQRWFLILFGLVGLCLPALLSFFPSQAGSNWLRQIGLPVVTGYVGYYVAGYYFRTYDLSRRTRAVVYVLGGVGGCATVLLGGDVFGDLTPNVACMAAALFVLCRQCFQGRGRVLRFLSDASFGVYLIHPFFILCLNRLGLSTLSFSPILSVPLLSLAVLCASVAASWLIGRIPVVGAYLT